MSSVQPIWITPPGSLGTVPEGTFYQVPLQVDQPGGDPVYFEAIAGSLPSGIQCTANGVIQGVPTNVVTTANEAIVAGINVTSKFAIRAYTTSTVGNITVINKLADRTFTLTVAGQNNPTWITPGATILSNVTITNNTGGFTSSAINLTPGQVVSVSGSFSAASGNILVPTYTGSANYYVLSTSVPDGFVLIDDLENPVVLSNVTIANTAGGFVFDAANSVVARPLVLTVDQPVLITGNFNSASGNINIPAYTGNTTYYIKSTNSANAFVLSASPGGNAIVTTVGNTTGTNFSLTNNIITSPGNTNGVTFSISGALGNYFYTGQQLEPGIQLEYTNDNTTGIPPAITLFSGSLPPGLTLSPTGLISGIIGLNPAISLDPGFDNSPFDAKTVDSKGYLLTAPFDFDVASENANYEFTLRLTDGRVSVFRTFSMYVWSTSTFNASTTEITADNTNLTVDISTNNIPVILNEEGSIGTAPNSTFFAYQFLGEDISGDNVGFIGYFIPPGLTLDTESGWLYGYLPNLGLTEQTYNFQVAAYSIPEPTLISATYKYSLTVTGPISTNVTWLTPSNLGTINNGSTSILYVEAKTTANLPLQYRIASGSDSRLPQGLTLLPSGHIVGRVSFNTFAIDDGNTTFDSDTTTFDLTCTFTVNAYSINGFVSVNKTFTVRVVRKYDKPYENLYIQCMPPVSDRSLIQTLVQNSIIFPPSLIYRNDDTNFGVANQVVYHHAYGLAADTVDTYVSALQLNHYWKNLILGEIKTAQAVDPVTGNIIYEVVYSEIIDTLVNNEGVSVGKEVVLPYLIENQTVDVVYPNSLENMRDQVIDVVGQESDILPLWMQSVQTNGNVLGFTPAWVIAYTLPGKSGQIQYNIQSQFGIQLNQVDFQADRYELDRALTVNWDAEDQQWIPTPPEGTTFDINYHYNFILTSSGNGYAVGNQIKITGNNLTGSTPVNDALITVNTVSNTGAIISAFYEGTANLFAYGNTYSNISGTNVTGTGTGAIWTVIPVPGRGTTVPASTQWLNNNNTGVGWINNSGLPVVFTPGGTIIFDTTFDGGSITFSSPADVYTNTDAYNKYLLFPKYDILNPLPEFGGTEVYWINNYNEFIQWNNNSSDPVAWIATQ